MAMSFTRPDPSSPNAVSSATFPTSRKGFEQGEVRDFLRMVAAELARLQEREKFLERELRTSQRSGVSPVVALDEEVVTRMLGEEAARILHTAREAASQIKIRSEESAARLLREATDEAQRVREEAEVEAVRRRQDASADAEAELQMAKQQGRDMVNEARAYRERVLGELARRREMARQQIEQLVHGRDRMLQAFERARISAVDVMAELTPLAEPSEYVNLSPTTGPVPLMVPASQVRPAVVPEPDTAHAADAADINGTATGSAPQAAVIDISIDDEPEPEAANADSIEAEVIEAVAAVTVETVDDAEANDTSVTSDTAQPDGVDDTGPLATVVSLFGPSRTADTDTDADADADADTAESQAVVIDEPEPIVAPVSEATSPSTRESVDDLFAKLRASSTDTVVERVRAAEPARAAEPSHVAEPAVVDATEELSVFHVSPEAPATDEVYDDTPFGRRDAELTPLIVAGARKLKRVLADEQNDVLHALRGAKGAVSLVDLVPPEAEHVHQYAEAIADDLRAAALAGASSTSDGSRKDLGKAIAKGHTLQPAVEALAASLVRPLRDRLDRTVQAADGDAEELSMTARAVYREWKTQRIDEHLDDVMLMAFGRGALAGLTPGTPVCWSVDPNGPACPDAEDNTLAGVVGAGDPFPTDHVCAPAHEGCRCMLQRAPQ